MQGHSVIYGFKYFNWIFNIFSYFQYLMVNFVTDFDIHLRLCRKTMAQEAVITSRSHLVVRRNPRDGDVLYFDQNTFSLFTCMTDDDDVHACNLKFFTLFANVFP